ncbi:DUF2637 domain-containing protein [Myceligenerans salitolerans]|uniref:DUF2637 domain-containing protein n=1 Tax=Myceligenerans salitolerans TaxID=1230528 RepID=A0ABS3I982_9MICO|nr:DUF2637 domain-containing protein [Myceligenerans salitolerans]MBO0609574.1 DUF2637 domain-containing protein [Myceligenerans salitolerans]
MTRPPAGPVARIAADSRPVLVFTVALTVAVALASFALSFASLRDAATWGRVPEALAFLVPVVIDASVLVYGLVALVLRARGRSSAWAWLLMFGFTVVSVGANAAHAYDVGPEVRALVGVVLVALAPLSVLTSTHALASLVVADAPGAGLAAEPVTTPEPVSVRAAEVVPAAEPEPVPAIATPAEQSAPAETRPEPVPAPTPVPAPVVRRAPRVGRAAPLAQATLPGLDFEPAAVTS